MARVSRYGKPYATRFKKAIEKKLQQYCIEHEVNESDVIQAAVECFLNNSECVAKRRL